MKRQVLCILWLVASLGSAWAQDRLLEVCKSELNDQMKVLKGKEFPPYYMSYLVVDKQDQLISASFGSVAKVELKRTCFLTPQVRLGDRSLDNFVLSDVGTQETYKGYSHVVIPIEDNRLEDAVRQGIRMEMNVRYQFAEEAYKAARTRKSLEVAGTDKSGWFTQTPVEKLYEEPLPAGRMRVDEGSWRKRLQEISGALKDYGYLSSGTATLEYVVERRYFVDTEGTEVVQNLPYVWLTVQASAKAEDGMLLPLSLSYFAAKPEDLPDNARLVADAREMAGKLDVFRKAPLVDPYSGPALFSGEASAVFFHEAFGHLTESTRLKRGAGNQALKSMMSKQVMATEIQVFDDPTLRTLDGRALSGFYWYDDQGVKAQRVQVVKDGKLDGLLMTRMPLEGHLQSNGHARTEGLGHDPIARQSTLIVETRDRKSEAELKTQFIEELKRQGKAFGYFFKQVAGKLEFNTRKKIDSFRISPVEVYRVYADGRPDEPVRGAELIGTPLAMFSGIVSAGGEKGIFTGICGAESGKVPVAAVSPMVLVNKIELQRKVVARETQSLLPDPTLSEE